MERKAEKSQDSFWTSIRNRSMDSLITDWKLRPARGVKAGGFATVRDSTRTPSISKLIAFESMIEQEERGERGAQKP